MSAASSQAERLHNSLAAIGGTCAGLCLLVAPFHASAGHRGVLLTLTVLAVLASRSLRDRVFALWSAQRGLMAVVLWWVFATLAWSLALPPHEAGEWKRDVLSSALALPVFFALTRDRRDLERWAWIFLLGLAGLTVFILRDPTDAQERLRQPWYGGVGALSTWLIALAALLPWLFREARENKRLRLLLAGMVPLLIVCAYLTQNRTVWGCYAAMLSLYVIGNLVPPHMPRMRWGPALLTIAAGVGLFFALAFASAQERFEHEVIARAEADPRVTIWRESAEVMSRNFATGLGFGIAGLRPRLEASMADPALAAEYGHAHNLVLNYALQMGVAGVVTILALMGALLAAFVHMRGRGGACEWLGLCGILLVSGIFMRNMTDDFFNRHNALQFWAIAGMLLGLAHSIATGSPPKENTEENEPENPHPAP